MTKAILAFFLYILALPALASDAPSEPRSDWTATGTLWESGLYGYDDSGHVASIGADVYRYDKVGRLQFATAGTVPPPPGQLPANQQEFEYDRYGNLLFIRTTTAQEAMRYGFAVDAATNRLGLACSGTVDGCFTGFYDAATGNQLGRAGDGEYVWDALGMLAELNTSRRERYIYDAEGERILIIDKVTGNERYTLRNPAAQVARELSRARATNTWKLDKDYVYRGATLIASFSGAQTTPDRHYHVDHLGSTRLVTDGSGSRRAIHTYWPFGPEAAGSEADGERLKFTGHERDSSPATSPGSDLDYMHARYYDANAGRFLTVDPGKDWNPGEPQSWNSYVYAANDPVAYVDDTGRFIRYFIRKLGSNVYREGTRDAAVLAAGDTTKKHAVKLVGRKSDPLSSEARAIVQDGNPGMEVVFHEPHKRLGKKRSEGGDHERLPHWQVKKGDWGQVGFEIGMGLVAMLPVIGWAVDAEAMEVSDANPFLESRAKLMFGRSYYELNAEERKAVFESFKEPKVSRDPKDIPKEPGRP